MRALTVLEIATVSGGEEENFSGKDGCPAGYSGVSLYTVTTTAPSGIGISGTGSTTGVTSGGSITATVEPPTSTTAIRYECLKDIPAGSSGSGAASGRVSGGTVGGEIAIDGNDYEWDPV